MSNASARKGAGFEISLLPLLREIYSIDVERLKAQGIHDRGDFAIPGERRFILEAKNERGVNLAGWYREAVAEADFAAALWSVAHVAPLVVHKRRGKTDPREQWVTTTLGELLALLGEGHNAEEQ